MDLAIIISSFLSGVLGSMGLGGGSVLIIYLTSFLALEQKKAQGINLVFFIPIAILSVILYRKEKLITPSEIKPVIFPSLLGAAAGFILLSFIPASLIAKLFGALLVIMGLRQLFLS